MSFYWKDVDIFFDLTFFSEHVNIFIVIAYIPV